MHRVWDLLSMSILGLFLVPLVFFAWTQHTRHLWIFLGLVLVYLGSEGIKHYLLAPTGWTIAKRPAGASNCNLWCDNGRQEGRPGMPSTHSAEAAYMALVYGSNAATGGIVWWIYAAAVMLARYQKRCHTIPQLLAGDTWGWSVYQLIHSVMPE